MAIRLPVLGLALSGLFFVVADPACGCDPGKPPGLRAGIRGACEDTARLAWGQGGRSTFSHLVSLSSSGYNPDCNPWLTADESEMFYIIRDDRNGPSQPGYQGEWDIYHALWDPLNRAWGPGTNLGPNINTVGTERRPSSTATGDTLFFERDDQVFVSLRTQGVFGPPVLLFPGRDPAVTSDAQHLYFVRGGDIWVADRSGSIYTWTNIHELGPPVNTVYAENRPFVSADGTRLLFGDFGNSRPGGYGGDDIWVSTWTGSAWGIPVNIGPPVNTDLWSCSPFLSRDGRRLLTGGEAFEGSRGDEDLWVAFLDSTLAPRPVPPSPGEWTKTGELPGAWNVYDLVAGGGDTVYAATMPNARVFRSTDGGDSWEPTTPLPGASIAYSLLAASNGSIYVGTYPHADVFRTTDGGGSWQPTADLPDATTVRALLETSDGRILAGTSPLNGIYATTDGGNTWDPLGAPADLYSGVTTLFETSTGTLFAGGWGRPYRSDDGGLTWNPQSLDPHFGGNLSSIHSFLETEGGVLWCTGWVHQHGGYVFRSTDGGALWDTTGTITAGPVHAVRVYDIVQVGRGALLIGFQTGLDSVAFISSDGGGSWTADGALLGAHEALRLLRLQDGTILAATAPNGDVYRRTPGASGIVAPADPEDRATGMRGVSAVLGGSPNPFHTVTTISYQLRSTGRIQLSVLDAQGRQVRVLREADTPAGIHAACWDGRDDEGRPVGGGVYFVRLDADRSVTYQKLTYVP